MPNLLLILLLSCSLQGATLRYWVQSCPESGPRCNSGDPELAAWAMEAWQAAAAGALTLVKTDAASNAHIRVYWAGAEQGMYGEARPIVVDGVRGAELYVIAPAGNADALLRDTILYLTCVHETGHALGLPHTRAFADIMYSFQYGGDIPEYFGRYRRELSARADIRKHSGISPADRARLIEILKAQRTP